MRFRHISSLVQVRLAGRGIGVACGEVGCPREICGEGGGPPTYCSDKHSLLELHVAACGKTNMWELAESLSYDGPLELLSMWTYLFSGGTLTTPSAHALLGGGKARACRRVVLPILA